MALKITGVALFLYLFVASFNVSHALDGDALCLKSIKDSLQDPLGSLQSWDFTGTTEGVVCCFAGISCGWSNRDNQVSGITLRDMGLKGNFPRGLEYCKNLNTLDLSNNSLSRNIPSNIADLLPPYVTSLILSGNNFSGEIPKSLANCSYLNSLYLDHNQLTGSLPKELGFLTRLKSFNVSNNLLVGPVPDFPPDEIMKDSYANNGQLCGGPLEPCLHKHEKKPVDHDWFKIGFGTGFLVSAVTVFMSFSTVSRLQVKNTMRLVLLSMVGKKNGGKKDGQALHFPTLNHEKEIPRLEKLVCKMNFADLCKATNNFKKDNVIGEGKTGIMYKATLQNGWFLAVKRLNNCPQFESQIGSERLALARMRHDNLIPLLGFYMENNVRLLVYKYMSSGNLHDWLRPAQGEAKILEWPLRIKIAMGVARGLAWLHHKCNFRVVHGNITSSCVLLDSFFGPKISNFGSAVMLNYAGAMSVFPNENDSDLSVNSEVWESNFVKKDVHDFGIMLLELITGSKTVTGSTSCGGLHNTLVEWINLLSTSSYITNDAIDKNLIGRGYDGEILQLLGIASDCVHPFPYERPTMLLSLQKN